MVNLSVLMFSLDLLVALVVGYIIGIKLTERKLKPRIARLKQRVIELTPDKLEPK